MSGAVRRFALRAVGLAMMGLLPGWATADDQAEWRAIEEKLALKITIETSDGAERIAAAIAEKCGVSVEFSPAMETLGVTK